MKNSKESTDLNIECRGKGRALVFFHGWGFDHQVWFPLMDDLARDHTCYLVDLPGFGASPAMDWSSFKLALLSNLPNSFGLIGWSMGGLFATRLALEWPNALDVLINITSSPRFLSEKGWPGVDPVAFRAFGVQLRRNPQEMIAKFSGVSDTVAKAVPSLERLKAGLSILAEWDLRDRLSELRLPTAYFWGCSDPIVPIVLRKTLQQQYPHFSYPLFEQSGHAPFITEKEKFLLTLRQQLSMN